MHDLGTLGGSFSEGLSINARGWVTGDSYTAGDAEDHAFFYDGTMHDLGTFGGTLSNGQGINASGQEVGYSNLAGDNDSHAFLYTTGTGVIDLNSLIDPLSGWELQQADAVNDAGQITGFGMINGESDAFLLTPKLLRVTIPQCLYQGQ